MRAALSRVPAANILVAADLLYLKSTSIALARRCVEALRSPACELVLVGDCGRPGRAAFLSELVRLGIQPGHAVFETVSGWTAGTVRHELISSRGQKSEGPTGVQVGLLRLTSESLCRDNTDNTVSKHG